MTAEQEREDCRKVVEEAVSTFRLLISEPYNEFTFDLDDFKEPERDDYMGLFKGTEGAKEFYQTLLKFWVYTFFGFCENHGWHEKFDLQAREALCEKVTEATMRTQIRECKARVWPNPYARGFGYKGRRLAIYRMFNDEKRVSFAVETTQNYYAFFYERQVGLHRNIVYGKNGPPFQMLRQIVQSPAFETLPSKEKEYLERIYTKGRIWGRHCIQRVREVYSHMFKGEGERQE
jgi:hypothetical protein